MTRSAMIWRPAFENVMALATACRPGRGDAPETEAHAGASLYTTAGDYARFFAPS